MLQNLHCGSLICDSNTGSPGGSGSPSGSSKKSRLMFQSKNFNVNISNAFKVPLNGQDTLRVLNTVLRQQAANRYLCLFIFYCIAILPQIDYDKQINLN